MLPSYRYNLDPAEQAFAEIKPAMDVRDYGKAIESASTAMTMMQQSFLVTVLEHRAYAFEKQGQLDNAVKDTQEMISYNPLSGKLHLRLGYLYRLQGKHGAAINAYDIGLQSTGEDDPCHIQLLEGKELATKQNEVRIDFITKLSTELADIIVTLLPLESVSECLTVSNAWREKIFDCSSVWKTLLSGGGPSDGRIASIIPRIGRHVKEVTLTAADHRVVARYLINMTSGSFTNIRCLGLEANTMANLNSDLFASITRALGSIGNTLTNLDIEHDPYKNETVMLTDLLIACPNLKCLRYATSYYISLSNAIGDVMLLDQHNALEDMHLKSTLITRQDIEKLFLYCQKVRRLVMYGCDAAILEVIDGICPNLEILGYNPVGNPVPNLDCLSAQSTYSGLRQFYTRVADTFELPSTLLPIIRRNMHSLSTLWIPTDSDPESQADVADNYRDLDLRNLVHLTFWGDNPNIMQALLLRSISACTKLVHIEVVLLTDIRSLIDSLLKLPRLECLGLSYPSISDGEENIVQLLEEYKSTTRSQEPVFKDIRLRYCREKTVTNETLRTLSTIATLESVWLEQLPGISAQGLDTFLKDISSYIQDIILDTMEVVTDSTLVIIGGMKSLKRLHLEELTKVTDLGIMNLSEQATNLQSLRIQKCGSVTQNAINFAKKKVQSVTYIIE